MLHDLLGAEIQYRQERARAVFAPVSRSERYGRARRGRTHRKPSPRSGTGRLTG